MTDHVQVVIGTLGKPHGLRGEVALIVRTDIPEDRLIPGAEFDLDLGRAAQPDGVGALRTLTVESTRVQQGRWYVRFAEITGRTLAEALRGAEITLDVDRAEEFDEDPEAWYPDELTGLTVQTARGDVLGTVVGLDHYPAHDILQVRTASGERVMLPFVEELVPEVDLEAGVIIADPPGGLFDPENAVSERDGQKG